MDVDVSNPIPMNDSHVKMNKSQKQRHKKSQIKALKSAARVPKKVVSKSPSPHIILPESKGDPTALDSEDNLLELARNRLMETHLNTLRLHPIPRACTAGLIKDLCPLAVNIRFPTKRTARYVFVQFRSKDDVLKTQNSLSNQRLNDKPIHALLCSSTRSSEKPESNWCEPKERKLNNFMWNSLHITNLNRSTKRTDLAQIFPKAISINMPTYDDGSSKGHCTLKFASKKSASKAFKTRHGAFVRGSSICVNFSLKKRTKVQEQQPETAKRLHPESEDESELEQQRPAKSRRVADTQMTSEAANVTSDQFVIRTKPKHENQPNSNGESGTKLAKNVVKANHPKITNKHQMKDRKSVKQQTTSSFEALLKPPTVKNVAKKKKLDKNKKYKRR